MILVTGCNERYKGRIRPYLHSLYTFAKFTCFYITVGFEDSHEGVCSFTLPASENYGSPKETECIQHGSFLPFFKTLPDSEVIIYTDGDFIMQREMRPEEKDFLKLKKWEVVTGYNFNDDCTLENDAKILGMKCSSVELEDTWGSLIKKNQDWNAGFLAMRKDAWERLYLNYMADWEKVCSTFEHQARQQWLISYEIATLGFDVKVCPWSIHAHGHGGYKPGMERREDGIYVDGTLALFRHFL